MVVSRRDNRLSIPLYETHDTTTFTSTPVSLPLAHKPPRCRRRSTPRVPPPQHAVVSRTCQQPPTRPFLAHKLELDNSLRRVLVGMRVFDAPPDRKAMGSVEQRNRAVHIPGRHERQRRRGEGYTLDIITARLQTREDLA
ncbi:hypothetical protein JI435_407510 [Parastagonospora nodorum SN15]|uniref:Uncharacterized protein n=1 Tax=Phaeosphaeria nodorum (strain SN15 / ATCC MYA-4574 / FGSC 10173) TaxID=321614 RepID=A0A7U2I0Q5_PHANO|nr:hypothetical protein JI435_407510 [Parastagonospora nodorum SN15]